MENFESKVNQENQEETSPYEKLSDEEFYDLCRKKYEKQEVLLNYKTITFKKNDKGFYSNDLKKIVLIDNHEANEQVVEGRPYIVEVIRDTNKNEPRKGAIIVKVIKPAEFEDMIVNEETKYDLFQIQFFKSKKDPNQLVSRDLSKPTLIDRGCTDLIHPGDEVVGRVEDKGSIFIFKPIKKAEIWRKSQASLSYLEKKPIVKESTYKGIKLVNENSLYPLVNTNNDFVQNLNEADRLIIEEELRRQDVKYKEKERVGKLFDQALQRATDQAWIEYLNNNVLVEVVDKNKKSYKVKIDNDWHDVNTNTVFNRGDWQEDSDWRCLIPQSALKLHGNDDYFFEQLALKENLKITESDFNDLVPDKEFLGSSVDKAGEVSFVKRFRKMDCVKVPVNLPYISGNLVFEPLLVRRDDVWDSDWGMHKDDSNGASSFVVKYKLQSEKIEFNQIVKNLPDHVSQRIKNYVNEVVNGMRDPSYHVTSYEMASWCADYDTKINSFDKLSLSERLEASKKLTGTDLEVFKEKMLFTDSEFEELKQKFPVDKYATPDGRGGINYFGLPVSVEQACETKHYHRSGTSVEVPVAGKYNYNFDKYQPEQLSYWLDSHQEYFNKLERDWRGKARENTLPKLDCPIREEIENRCKALNISISGYNGKEFYYYQGGDKLNLYVNLSADFSMLNVVVNNINNGLSVPLNEGRSIYKLIKDNNWKINLSVKNILIKQGIEESLLNDLLEIDQEKLRKDQELPFKAL